MGGGIRGLFQFEDEPWFNWEDEPRLNPHIDGVNSDLNKHSFEHSFENFINIIQSTRLIPENHLMTLTVEPENRFRHGYGKNRFFLQAKDYLFKIYNYDDPSENTLLFCIRTLLHLNPKYNFAVVKIKDTVDTKEWDEGWEQGKWVLEVDLEETNKIIETWKKKKSKLSNYLNYQKDSSFNTLPSTEKITIPLRYKNKDTEHFEKPKNIDNDQNFISHLESLEKESILKKNKEELEQKINHDKGTFYAEIDEHNTMVDRYEFEPQLKISEFSGL